MDGRLKVTNHGVSTTWDLALWPCRATSGGIVVADTTQTQNVYQETCPSTLKFVSPLLTVGASGSTGQISLVGTTSGNVTLTPQAVAGSPTITFGTSSGTPAVTSSAPLSISSTTGNITCSTCMTTSTSVTASQMPALTGDCTSSAGTVATTCGGLLIDYQKAASAVASNNSADVALYSTSVPSQPSGHGIRIEFCAQHTTGSTSTIYKVKFGTAGSLTFSTSTGTGFFCGTVSIMNDPGSQTSQQIISTTGTAPTGSSIAPPVFATATETWTGSLTVSLTQSAPGTSDMYTPKSWKITKP